MAGGRNAVDYTQVLRNTHHRVGEKGLRDYVYIYIYTYLYIARERERERERLYRTMQG
jgi:hypothetical protein